jgi:hypothetical protein
MAGLVPAIHVLCLQLVYEARDLQVWTKQGSAHNPDLQNLAMNKLPAKRLAAATPSKKKVILPAVTDVTGAILTALTNALGVPRDVLAADDQIDHAWTNLPRLLSRIPDELRSDTIARMCVAVATGLFDSAVNYAWNAAISNFEKRCVALG